MSDNKTLTGTCLCGEVRFEVEPPVKFCAHCHCSMCRRAHGAAFVTWTGVVAERFRVTQGDTRLQRYESSPEATRSFCSQCGTTLFFESQRWAGEIHIVVSNLQPDHGLIPQAHVFFDDRADWVEIADALPRLGGASGVEPL